MLVLEYKAVGKPEQYRQIDEAVRTAQFVRNKCLRLWVDAKDKDDKVGKYDISKYTTSLRREFEWCGKLNSTAIQAAGERAWSAIVRFYDNCKKGVKPVGFPQFKRHTRSVEYKHSGWRLSALDKRITFTDGFGIGTLKLKGTYDFVAYEDLRVSNMVKNRSLAKSISDASWSQFRGYLEYFGKVFGKATVAVPPQWTSQDCSSCGTRVQKSLSTRTQGALQRGYSCPHCKTVLDRDENAARNILQKGLVAVGHTETQNAWGGDVGLTHREQTPLSQESHVL